MQKRKRILTGDRPTGKLHIGHYVGSLLNRVKLQHEYETFIIVADVQALTTHFEKPEVIKEAVFNVTLDNLAVGIDPQITTIFVQSQIPQIAELTVFLSMLVTVNALRHNPTIKTEASQYGYDDLTYGFLGYPVSQTADIAFCRADLVPVGEDQAPHIEVARKIVRRFNTLYGSALVEPDMLIGDCPRLIGTDGNAKMGKSLNNAIYLADTKEEVNEKIMNALTDANRIKLKDKGNPDVCVVYKYHSIFNKDECANVSDMCRNASIGCVACKKNLANILNGFLEPIRDRRKEFEGKPELVVDILEYGSEKARKIGEQTLLDVKKAMGILYH